MTGGGAETLPGHIQVLHYGVDAGPPPPTPNQQLDPSPFLYNTRQQRHLSVSGRDSVGILQPLEVNGAAQGRTESPLLFDSKSVPVTNFSTEVNAQTTCPVNRSFTGCSSTLHSWMPLSASFQGP